MSILSATALAVVLAAASSLAAKPAPAPSPEARTAAYMASIAADRAKLRLFLQAMPKGADLHNHLGGSTYAEDALSWAGDAGLCIDIATAHIVDAPCKAPGSVPAEGLDADAKLYSRVVDAISTRGFERGFGDPRIPGQDRFFHTFEAFGPGTRGQTGKIIATTLEQAAYDHVGYIEPMTILSPMRALLPVAMRDGGDGTDFAKLDAAIAPAMAQAVAAGRAEMDAAEAEAKRMLGCGTASAQPGCAVAIRYLPCALRNLDPRIVFAQLAYGFALAEADTRFVGVNIVAPEHEPVPRRDYALHMAMLKWLKAKHPNVALSLHAGELTLGLVPPRDLKSHIAQAVDVAGAKRIGHGVDIAFEADAPALLRRMAKDRVAVEINLTSNDVILGVKGADHPLALYRSYGVPVVLSTDDEGVARSDMTNEYLRAATDQKLGYRDLKAMARDSLQYAFLEGQSLWADRSGGARVAACADMKSAACATFIAASPKAQQQARFESDLDIFENIHFR
ncbi:adenosine deaminase [Sphingomonas crocodyli]|uniref:adenosine deaminase n=1 Tax=Sphingomonas crocodyli TaxID=1979270 RepID=A0A437LV55_9SPHN|nr:adenosine deaminase [Sphingomonas crocodyli]